MVAVATAAGAFVSLDGMRWQRLSEELPSGPATALALAAREGFTEGWVAIRGELWRSELRAVAGRAAATPPVRVAIPFASGQLEQELEQNWSITEAGLHSRAVSRLIAKRA